MKITSPRSGKNDFWLNADTNLAPVKLMARFAYGAATTRDAHGLVGKVGASILFFRFDARGFFKRLFLCPETVLLEPWIKDQVGIKG